MKKFLALALSFALTLPLAACGGNLQGAFGHGLALDIGKIRVRTLGQSFLLPVQGLRHGRLHPTLQRAHKFG